MALLLVLLTSTVQATLLSLQHTQQIQLLLLQGDLTGSVTLTNLASGTLTATIAANSVALGTDTTGNYVLSLADAGNGVFTIVNGVTEGGAATIDLANDSVALGTKTTGNYVTSVTNGSYILGADGGSESATLTLAVDAATAATAGKIVARDGSGDFAST